MGADNSDQGLGNVQGEIIIISKRKHQSECKRKQSEAENANKNILTPGAKKTNYTIASGGIRGEPSLLPAFCRQSYYKRSPKRYRQLLTGLETGNRDEIPLCGGDTHPSNEQACGHAEARIISELGSGLAGNTLIMSINLMKPNGELSKLPCPQCHALICAAIRSCDATIIVCDHDDKSVNMSDVCNEEGPSSRPELAKKLGCQKL